MKIMKETTLCAKTNSKYRQNYLIFRKFSTYTNSLRKLSKEIVQLPSTCSLNIYGKMWVYNYKNLRLMREDSQRKSISNSLFHMNMSQKDFFFTLVTRDIS